LEGFGSIEGVIQSNKELYDFLKANNGTAFVNIQDSKLMEMSLGIENRITYSGNHKDKFSAADYSFYAQTLQPKITFSLDGVEIESSLSGDYNFDNIMAAVAIGLHFGLSEDEIKAGIEAYKPSNLRSQLIEKTENKIFLDAYNANPSSMELSIRNFIQMDGPNKLLILGDMFEMGKYEAEEHQSISDYCKSISGIEVWLVGKAFYKTNSLFRKFEQTSDVIEELKSNPISSRFVFLKGSRGMKLESLIDFIK
jgi:UDP-N-acetylmuramoyl-tripeptide--D-alanyl-D-alanine ligase